MRRFADVFAYCNLSSFAELLYFEQNLVRSTIANFEELSSAGIGNATKVHGYWTNMTLGFTDIKHTMQALEL